MTTEATAPAAARAAHLRAVDDPDILLRAEHVDVEYPVRGRGSEIVGVVHAVSDVSIDVRVGETLGIVGESGSGKSSLGRALTMLRRPEGGAVYFEGQNLADLDERSLRRTRRRLQMIFQDPVSALNPRRTVRDVVTEGFAITRRPKSWDEAADEALRGVGLDPAAIGGRRPRELSGGQCQRVAIARALLLDPPLVVCDEPVSALDVSIQAQILNLLEELKATRSLTLVFIAHDLAVVRHISDRIAVMYLGKLCELATSDALYEQPMHPYTEGLLRSIPDPDPDAPVQPLEIRGDLPSPTAPPSGCRFRTRCPHATERCAEEEPALRELRPGHFAACHFPLSP